ncbi:hypothetical protein T484DRAFT_1757903 [Baffinella frigidus]|nr:hypothetical protein T484DRAFT_1757903 [Cryptophyta sp. CCMP2293]
MVCPVFIESTNPMKLHTKRKRDDSAATTDLFSAAALSATAATSSDLALASSDVTDPINKKPKKPTPEKKHLCLHPGCERRFEAPYQLKKHDDFVHKGIRHFVCDHIDVNGKTCTYACELKGQLIVHKRRHAGTKPYKCDHVDLDGKQCAYASVVSSHLNAHKRVHTKEKPFECQTCGKMFSTTSRRYDHYLRNHAPDDNPDKIKLYAKNLKCEYCPKTFSLWCNLNVHKLRHHTDENDPTLLKFRTKLNAWTRQHNAEHTNHRLKNRVRNGMRRLMARAGIVKDTDSEQLLGCSYDDFMVHLNNNDRGLTFFQSDEEIEDEEIELDHIRPFKSFKNLECRLQMLQVCNWNNYQLLTASDNNSKSGRFNAQDAAAYATSPGGIAIAALVVGWRAAGVCDCETCKM